jgi:phosphohistidine phosphatase SixA
MRRALLPALVLALGVPAAADIFIVRHAEKKSSDEKATLSEAGFKRAGDLRRVLASVDLKAVYRTEYERTRQTAAPTAAAHNLTPIELKSDDVQGLAKALRARPPLEDVLVVGHSDTIPNILHELGVSTRAVIGSGDYDNLFIVASRGDGEPGFHWLHYGDAPAPAAAPAAMKRKP